MQRPVSKKQSRSSEVIYFFFCLGSKDSWCDYIWIFNAIKELLCAAGWVLTVISCECGVRLAAEYFCSAPSKRLWDSWFHNSAFGILVFFYIYIYIFLSARSEERFSPLISLFFSPPRPISFLRPFKPLSINLLLFCQFVSVLFTVAIILQMSAIIVSFIPSVRFRPHSVKNIEERKGGLSQNAFFFSLSLSLLFHYSLLRLGSLWFVHPGGTCINIWWFEKCNKEAKSAELFSSGSGIELTQLVLSFP